jgi:hypothetical protein
VSPPSGGVIDVRALLRTVQARVVSFTLDSPSDVLVEGFDSCDRGFLTSHSNKLLHCDK